MPRPGTRSVHSHDQQQQQQQQQHQWRQRSHAENQLSAGLMGAHGQRAGLPVSEPPVGPRGAPPTAPRGIPATRGPIVVRANPNAPDAALPVSQPTIGTHRSARASARSAVPPQHSSRQSGTRRALQPGMRVASPASQAAAPAGWRRGQQTWCAVTSHNSHYAGIWCQPCHVLARGPQLAPCSVVHMEVSIQRRPSADADELPDEEMVDVQLALPPFWPWRDTLASAALRALAASQQACPDLEHLTPASRAEVLVALSLPYLWTSPSLVASDVALVQLHSTPDSHASQLVACVPRSLGQAQALIQGGDFGSWTKQQWKPLLTALLAEADSPVPHHCAQWMPAQVLAASRLEWPSPAIATALNKLVKASDWPLLADVEFCASGMSGRKVLVRRLRARAETWPPTVHIWANPVSAAAHGKLWRANPADVLLAMCGQCVRGLAAEKEDHGFASVPIIPVTVTPVLDVPATAAWTSAADAVRYDAQQWSRGSNSLAAVLESAAGSALLPDADGAVAVGRAIVSLIWSLNRPVLHEAMLTWWPALAATTQRAEEVQDLLAVSAEPSSDSPVTMAGAQSALQHSAQLFTTAVSLFAAGLALRTMDAGVVVTKLVGRATGVLTANDNLYRPLRCDPGRWITPLPRQACAQTPCLSFMRTIVQPDMELLDSLVQQYKHRPSLTLTGSLQRRAALSLLTAMTWQRAHAVDTYFFGGLPRRRELHSQTTSLQQMWSKASAAAQLATLGVKIQAGVSMEERAARLTLKQRKRLMQKAPELLQARQQRWTRWVQGWRSGLAIDEGWMLPLPMTPPAASASEQLASASDQSPGVPAGSASVQGSFEAPGIDDSCLSVSNDAAE